MAVPAILRAYIGLVDTAVTQVRELVDHPRDLPIQTVSKALQLSIKAQHAFTDLTVRGDEVIGRLRGAPAEAPAWAQFDDGPVSPPGSPDPSTSTGSAPPRAGGVTAPAAPAVSRFSQMADLSDDDPDEGAAATFDRPDTKPPAKKAPGKRVPGKKAPVKAIPARATSAEATARQTGRPSTPPLSSAASQLADQLVEDAKASIDRLDLT